MPHDPAPTFSLTVPPLVDASPPAFLTHALMSAFGHSAVGLAIRTTSGRLVDANPAYCQMLGYSLDEILRMEFAAIVHPCDLEAHARRIRQMERGDLDVMQFEQRLCRKDGSIFWATVSVTTIRDDDGQFVGMFALVQDVSARKAMEARHRDQEVHLAALVDRLPIALFSHDVGADRTFPFVSPRFVRATGYGADDLSGPLDHYLDHVHPDDRDMVRRAGERADRTGESVNIEYRLGGRGGEWCWVDQRSELIRDEVDRPVAWKGIVLDVSERRRLEASLRDSERRFRRAFAEAAIGMTLGGPDNTCLDANAAYCRLIDLPRERVIGQSFVEYTHPDDRRREAALYARLRAGEIDSYQIEKRYRRGDGGYLTGLLTVAAVRDEQGEYLYDIGQLQDITAQRDAEAALRASEAELRTIIEQLPAAVYRIDQDADDYAYVSPQFTEFTGIGNDGREGRYADYCRLVHPDDQADLRQADDVATGSGMPLDEEYRILAPDGSWRWVQDRALLMRDEAGHPRSWLGVLLDVSERKRLQEALRDHETHLASVVENLPAALYRIEPGPEGRYSYGSSRFVDLTGLSPDRDHVDAATYRARIHPDDLPAVVAMDRESAATNRPFDCEYRLRGADEQWVWVHDRSRPALDPDGNPVAWYGILIDITARRHLEEALAQNDARLRAIIEQLPAAVYQMNAEGEFTYASPRFEALTGLSVTQGTLDIEQFFARLHPDDEGAIRDLDDEAERSSGAVKGEYRIQGRDGDWIWLETRSTPQHDDAGGAIAWHGLMLDITERKRLEAELEKNEAHLQVLVEQAPAALYTLEVRPEGCRYTYLSPQFTALTGLSLDTHASGFKAFMERVHPDDVKTYEAIDQQAIEANAAFSHEYRLRDPQGNWIWIHERSVRAQAEHGKPRAWHGVLLDVTERKQLEATVRENEARLKLLFEQLPVALYSLQAGPDERFIYASPQMETLLGVTPRDLARGISALNERVHPDDRERVIAADQHSQATGEPFTLEYWAENSKGGWGWIHERAVLTHDDDGRPAAWHGILLDMTAQKMLTTEVHEKEALVQSIFEGAKIGMTLVDLDGVVVLANPAMGELLGYTPDELIGRNVREFTHPDDIGSQISLRRQLQAGDISSYQLEKRYRRRDGSYVWGLLSVAPVWDAQGNLKASTGQVQDITTRKKVEAAFRESEKRFRTIFESAGIGMALGTPTGEVVLANPALERFLGYAPEELVGVPVRTYTHPDDAAIQEELRRKMLAGESSGYTMEKRYVRRDGSLCWGLVGVTAIRDEYGRLTATIGQVQDITARKQAEAALRDSEARFRALVQHDPDVILVVNEAREVIYASPSVGPIFGIAPDDLLGPTQSRMAGIHPEDLGAVSGLVTRIMGTAGATATTELRLRDASGSWRWFQLTISNHLDTPSIGGFVCNLRDISERKESEIATAAAMQTQQAAIAELEQLNQSKSRFLSTISHEFRTPLTAIIGYSEMLTLHPDPKSIAEDAGIIHREASRLNRMVNDVLLVEQIDAERLVLKLRPTELGALARHVVDACWPIAEDHPLALDLDSHLVPVMIDGDRVAQALTNLISNAIKYSAPGKPIMVSTWRDGDQVCLAVRDEGIGIAAADIERIFSRFERIEQGMAGRIGGTGLGLAIARDIAELHQGALTVESELGHGSTFTLKLPVSPLPGPSEAKNGPGGAHGAGVLNSNPA
ncbi:MAG: PAS domain S-box protein [Thermomicrobiales bacterium]